jgi:hypothetical protein
LFVGLKVDGTSYTTVTLPFCKSFHQVPLRFVQHKRFLRRLRSGQLFPPYAAARSTLNSPYTAPSLLAHVDPPFFCQSLRQLSGHALGSVSVQLSSRSQRFFRHL